jgi:hypothetical protein
VKRKGVFLFITGLIVTILLLNCVAARNYNFSLKNTLSIFLLNDGKDYFFSIPIQYIGDYNLEDFEFNSGYIVIGDYEMVLGRDDISLDIFVNECSDEYGNTEGLHNLVYSEKNGKIMISKMDEPLTIKNKSEQVFNQYNIIIEKLLKDKEIKSITNKYKKGNTLSRFYLEYAVTIDNEQMEGCGYSDDFELYNGPVDGSDWFPPNLDFFRTKVLKK